MNRRPKERRGDIPSGLGTFSGVFTPSILTILGIILFLRLGFVVGSAGFLLTLVIISLASTISILTTVSLSAIATNLKVKGGGDYYLISRTLGLEFGGAIGLVLFLAQSISIAFYCMGFGEAVGSIFPESALLSPRYVAAAAVGFLFIFAWLGADWATRFQYGVMTVLTAALLSFFIGGIPSWSAGTLMENLRPPDSAMGFWALFAIFFPAVTGFTQGISMSGDLKDPSGSLPRGTFLAVGISIVIYFAVAVVFSGVLSNADMARRYDSMQQVSRWGFLIDAGVIAATLSSAMASFLGAPRILQSLAADRIFNFLNTFSKGSGPAGNPRRGVLLSGAIAMVTVMLGKLDLIAPLVSMFFLISYGLLNYATYYEARSASPSFRPKFRWFHLRWSLLGFIVCLGVMLAIDIRAGIIAISILVAVYHYLKHTAGPSRWADSTRAYRLQRVRENILAAAEEPGHPRDWRPVVLAMTNDQDRRERLLTFSSWIEGGTGMTTAVRFIEGDGPAARRREQESEKELSSDIRRGGMSALPLVIRAPDILEAFPVALQSYGIGPLKANTLLINWFGQLGTGIPGIGALHYVTALRKAYRQGLNLVIFKSDTEQWERILEHPSGDRRIDIWWQNNATSRLMLLLAHLMKRSDVWSDASLRVIAQCWDAGAESCESILEKDLEEMRVDASVAVVEDFNADTIVANSTDSGMVFLPFRISGHQLKSPTGDSLERTLPRLPATALLMAAEEIDLDAEPEEGAAAELAAAADALVESEKRAALAEKAASDAREKAAALVASLQTMKDALDLDPEALSKLHAESIHAIEASEKAFRKAGKARAKAKQAARTAADLGIEPPPQEVK